jgi:hypothetical protein
MASVVGSSHISCFLLGTGVAVEVVGSCHSLQRVGTMLNLNYCVLIASFHPPSLSVDGYTWLTKSIGDGVSTGTCKVFLHSSSDELWLQRQVAASIEHMKVCRY